MVMRSSNRLIQRLEADAKEKLQERATRLKVSRGDVLQQAASPVEYVYFPETALLSAAIETIAGESVDVGLLGPEDVFGAFEACGSRQSFARLDVRIGGAILRIPASHYREVFERSETLRTEIHKYVELTVTEARQFIACNALHAVEARLARALLDASDRAKETTLSLTQDALAHLLGVQRTTVAAAVSAFQRQGLVRTARGSIEIVDLDGLEQVACSCRATLAFARDQILVSGDDVCDA
jgi:CRP-like cAMP-binding protein